eukprot:2537010-Rhodomonas_salina.3
MDRNQGILPDLQPIPSSHGTLLDDAPLELSLPGGDEKPVSASFGKKKAGPGKFDMVRTPPLHCPVWYLHPLVRIGALHSLGPAASGDFMCLRSC